MTADQLELDLIDDLQALGDRLADERLCRDLYRAFAGNALSKRDATGHVTPSWKRAEDILGQARRAAALEPIDGLAGSGGEGEVSDRARDALQELGWTVRPQDHGHADPAHTGSERDAPPQATPAGHEPPDWERQAHEEAERNRLR